MACGAIAQPIAEASTRHSLPVDVHPLPPQLHNRPERIAGEVEALVTRLRERYALVAVGYADCGTYGALDEVCARLGVPRLAGMTCYDIYAGARTYDDLMEEQPGTFVVTDFLVRAFERTVIAGLGLDRYPELRDDYFQHYTRMVWMVQTSDRQEQAELRTLAQAAAERLGLPLQVVPTGVHGMAAALQDLVDQLGIRATDPRVASAQRRAAAS